MNRPTVNTFGRQEGLGGGKIAKSSETSVASVNASHPMPHIISIWSSQPTPADLFVSTRI